MEKVVMTRFGEKIIRYAMLQVGYKSYRVRQTRYSRSANPPLSTWKLTKAQILSILRCTEPSDWWIKSHWHYDGMVDGTVYDQEDFHQPKSLDWLMEDIQRYDFLTYYNPETGCFEIFNIALASYDLKPNPSSGLTVTLRT